MQSSCCLWPLASCLEICYTSFIDVFPGNLGKRQFFKKRGFILSQKNRPLPEKLLPGFTVPRALRIVAGAAIVSFGLYNVHRQSGITEGGVLGAVLLLHHWFGLSPSISGLVLNAACYIGGWRTLGRSFIFYSVIAGGGFSAFYAFFERFDPLWPGLAQMPLVAAVVGALFVGVGAGLSVRAGGAPGGGLYPYCKRLLFFGSVVCANFANYRCFKRPGRNNHQRDFGVGRIFGLLGAAGG